tara:strand:+ start:603 stop:1712 length:1110 start_codon:yes stop_codon:yes gene_type:complete
MTKINNAKIKEVNKYINENEQPDVKYINQELKKNPGNQFLKISQARILIKMDELKKARKIFIKMEDELLDEYLKFYFLAKAEYKLAKRNENKAVDYLLNALRLDRHFVEALEKLAEFLCLKLEFKKIVLLLRDVPANCMSAKLSFYLGKAYLWESEFNKAEEELEKSINGYLHFETHVMLGNLEELKVDSDSKISLAHFEMAFQLDPNNFQAILPLLFVSLENSDFITALEFQILLRDAFIVELMEELEDDDCDPKIFHHYYEPDLLELDLISCTLYLINDKIEEAESLIRNPFLWEYESEYFQIIKDFVNSFISGDQAQFNSSRIDLKDSLSPIFWNLIHVKLDQEFKKLSNKVNSPKAAKTNRKSVV